MTDGKVIGNMSCVEIDIDIGATWKKSGFRFERWILNF